MIRTIQLVWATAVLTMMVQTEPAEMEPARAGCSGFSEEQEHRSPHLSWRFRSCTSPTGQKELQLQFRNLSDQPISFEFRLWTARRRSCNTGAPPSARGQRHLRANQAEEWPPYTVSPLGPADAFKGRIWVCVKEVTR